MIVIEDIRSKGSQLLEPFEYALRLLERSQDRERGKNTGYREHNQCFYVLVAKTISYSLLSNLCIPILVRET